MSQLSLFDSGKKPAERRPPNLDIIRKYLKRLLYVARRAELMPWSKGEAQSLERRFPDLATHLGPEEGAVLAAEFAAELVRLRSAE